MGRNKTTKALNPALLAALRTISDEVPERCTPSEAWTWVRPVTPRGVEFLPGDFWRLLGDSIAWRNDMKDDAAERLAFWIVAKLELFQSKGKAWPPAPAYRAPVFQPTPWTGKHEKPGGVRPWDGKR